MSMSKLLIKPANVVGKIHDISPEKAGWGYVGFDLYYWKRASQ